MRFLPVILLLLNTTSMGASTVHKTPPLVKPGSLIVNQAADAIVGYLKLDKPLGRGATKPMAEAALRQVVDQYQATRVSHVFWNVCYQRAAYRSDVWASYWDVPNPSKNTVNWPRKYYQLHRLGIDDAFALLIARCREKGISPWVSLRMNDMHYNEDPRRMNPFWNDNPQFWILKKPGFANGFDFTQAEVRAHYMKLVGEVLSRWDIDGVELDWMRFPYLFRPGDGENARAALTAFMREARTRATAAAKRLGHPVGIAVRVPATPEFASGLGMDAVTWAREGLVDVLIPGSIWRPSFPDVPVETWRERVGPNCTIVPATDLWIGGMPGGVVAATGMAPMRGFTASMLDRGADGIYLFNHFAPTDTKLSTFTIEQGADRASTLGDLLAMAGDAAKALAGPRRHVLTFHNPAPRSSGYRPPLPSQIAPEKPARFRVHIGPAPDGGACRVRVGLSESDGFDAAVLSAKINGTVCRDAVDVPRPAQTQKERAGHHRHPAAVAPRLLQFDVPPDSLRRGYNEIEIGLARGKPQQIVWVEMCISPH